MVPSPTVSEVIIPFLMVPSPTVSEVTIPLQIIIAYGFLPDTAKMVIPAKIFFLSTSVVEVKMFSYHSYQGSNHPWFIHHLVKLQTQLLQPVRTHLYQASENSSCNMSGNHFFFFCRHAGSR